MKKFFSEISKAKCIKAHSKPTAIITKLTIMYANSEAWKTIEIEIQFVLLKGKRRAILSYYEIRIGI